MNYDTICLSSGGIYGIAYLGALDYLIEEKILSLDKIKNYVGCSVGSLFLFMIILGYSIKDINHFIIEFNFNKLENEIKIENILTDYGINNGNKVVYLLNFFLYNKLNIDDITFEELFIKNNKKFIVIGTNYSTGTEAIFSHLTTPDMSIITAIRISTSIPVIFTPILYKDEYYMDGALTNIFPINHCNQETTIGINLPYSGNYKINNIFDIFLNSIKIILKSVAYKNEYKVYDNIINILNEEFNPVDLNITLEIKIKLLNIGRKSAIEHVNNSKLHIKKICSDILSDIINKIH